LTFEPQLKRALQWAASTELLEPEGLDLVRRQFDAITETLTEQEVDAREDLMVPAVLWLTYLLEEQRRSSEGK